MVRCGRCEIGGNVIGRLVWIVGLGSDHGDDRVGWEVAVRLQETAERDFKVTISADPLCITESPTGCDLLLVIDACRGAGSPGSIHRFEWPDPKFTAIPDVSSHGISLSMALELAATLGRLPPSVVVLAIEGEAYEPGMGLSPSVEAKIPALVECVLTEVLNPPQQS
ncbi:MAG: peptidase M52 [Planctomycetaceae bacterium]|nr:peptidase M52 [Planctomycetaceae bacterium]